MFDIIYLFTRLYGIYSIFPSGLWQKLPELFPLEINQFIGVLVIQLFCFITHQKIRHTLMPKMLQVMWLDLHFRYKRSNKLKVQRQIPIDLQYRTEKLKKTWKTNWKWKWISYIKISFGEHFLFRHVIATTLPSVLTSLYDAGEIVNLDFII